MLDEEVDALDAVVDEKVATCLKGYLRRLGDAEGEH